LSFNPSTGVLNGSGVEDVDALSDDELEAVMSAARPLQPKARTEFLTAVAAELERQPERGPGVIYRVCRELQLAPRRRSPAKSA
jgi:hypothetical protein